jgi:hypothetical protein
MLLAAPAPAYDPWAWLLWGREVTEGTLSTSEGPAFKPLPVLVTTLLAPFGGAAPVLWVLLARAAALAAVLFAFMLGRRLGGSASAGWAAAIAVAGTQLYLQLAASGHSEGILLALALGGYEAWLSGRRKLAFACAVGCGLVRVETWPFLLVAAIVAWRRRPAARPALAAAVLLVPAAWLIPELIGSGDLLRAGARARIAEPGQPALAGIPAWASLRDALGLVPLGLWPGLVAAALLAPATLLPAAAGAAWLLVVAAMAQAGFSGEARYALPGAALIALSAAAGLAAAAARRGVPVALVVVAVLGVVLAERAGNLADIRARQAHQWALQADLEDAVAAAGGRSAVLACGRPAVGRLRGPLLAYRLHVEKQAVEPDEAPRAPGVAFLSRLTQDARVEPRTPAAFSRVAEAGEWEVRSSC